MIIDGAQYANWSEHVFSEMRQGGVAAVIATIAYHETFRDTVAAITAWHRRFAEFGHLIAQARSGDDVRAIAASGRSAILFGLQTPAPIEADVDLLRVLHELGVRIMQLTYNTQSLLGSGYQEERDCGITRMGREVIGEMNRIGLAIDMSHAGERTTLEAIDISGRPVAISHANPRHWHDVPRNVSDTVIRALARRGGMLGLSLYPHHMNGGSAASLADFAAMVARTAGIAGVAHLGIGSDLCQDQPASVLAWMRQGRWSRARPVIEGFPPPVTWFRDNRDFGGIAEALHRVGFSTAETDQIMGGNWLRFFDASFSSRT